jgi:preprotein translocase subunit SecA
VLEEKIVEKIESIKSSVIEAEFYDYEKRLYLQSVDELWMRHIDDMSHLREEVAFE